MSPRQAQLSRYYPHAIAVAATVAVGYSAYYLYNRRQSHSDHPTLHRSNARRRARPNRRSLPDSGGVFTNEQLSTILGEGGVPEAPRLPPGIDIPDSVAEALVETGHAAQEARGAGRDRTDDDDLEGTEFSFNGDKKENVENQNLLTLLYTIAQDQATRESYVHRGVTCNNCGAVPIRGVRYRCANCLDYDLCEHCEALDAVHPKTHLFYKVRIPAPFLGNPRNAQTPIYPGKPHMMPINLASEVKEKLEESTKFDQPEIEALYEQFKTLAAADYVDNKFEINAAISRQSFDKCFIPNTHLHPPPPNLIYDRMFSFYDTNNDGLISFDEFVVGLAASNNKGKGSNRLKRIFKGYDLNNDGYIDRQDFLRMFRAFYALSKDLVKDIVASMGDDLYDPNHLESVVHQRQPVSAAFSTTIPTSNNRPFRKPRPGEDEEDDTDAPAIVPSIPDVIAPSEIHSEIEEPMRKLAEAEKSKPETETTEAERALEQERRREFFPLRQNMEEEWAFGMDVWAEEPDVGSEVLFQMSMQGINELLDLLFKAKERAAVEARRKRDARKVRDEKKESGTEQEDVQEEEKENVTAPATPEDEEKENKSEDKPVEKEEKEEDVEEEGEVEKVREEIEERGGEGRLNLQEFEAIMKGEDMNRLRFVGSWIEIASF